MIVISATAGIEVNTRRLFKAAQDAGLPIAIVINKIDSENINFEALMEQLTETFGSACKAMNLPGDGCKAVVDCFSISQSRCHTVVHLQRKRPKADVDYGTDLGWSERE